MRELQEGGGTGWGFQHLPLALHLLARSLPFLAPCLPLRLPLLTLSHPLPLLLLLQFLLLSLLLLLLLLLPMLLLLGLNPQRQKQAGARGGAEEGLKRERSARKGPPEPEIRGLQGGVVYRW